MFDRCVKLDEAGKIVSVPAQPLRLWGSLLPPGKRTPEGPRLYSLQELLGFNDLRDRLIAYARVSGSDAKGDLERQRAVLEAFCHKNGGKLRA